MRKTVGARELKTRLGTYLHRVRAGETLVVTDRGEPVAELRPIRQKASGEGARLEELMALGAVTRLSNEPLPSIRPIINNKAPVSDVVIADREDRL